MNSEVYRCSGGREVGKEALGVAKTDRIRRRKKGGASTITSASNERHSYTSRSCHLAGSSEKRWKEDEVNVEDDTELEEEEENPPALRETLVERSHREFWDAKERLKTAAHIKQIWKYGMALYLTTSFLPRR
ncbi:hypothetical protein V8E54_014564 [Elaphomyces granulatus]